MAVSLREVVSFGRYEPLFRIASGGMAEVYAARIRGEAGFQKLVAVKRMHPHLASDPTFVDMFLNEARLAAHVASPYVVQTLDLGRGSDGSLYIVMELVVGLSLAKLQEDEPGPLPVPIAVEVIAQAAQGLDDAHEATTPAGDPLGLVHRDVSPHNVLLGLDGRARVTDFGIAHAVHRPRPETNVKELKGKFPYMSPEQTRLLPLDRRSDLFSLGVVGWELLVGRRLFAENDPTASIRNVREMPIPAARALSPEVPEPVSAVIARALERDPGARFATGAEMARGLRDAARGSLDALPDRKAIAAFVREAGGEELERLRRLIRLGTEGAAAEALEAVQPGATRVLFRDASGVSRVGGSRPGTERIDDAEPSIPSVTLVEDDDPEHTSTAHVGARGEIPTDVLLQAAIEPPAAPPATSRGDSESRRAGATSRAGRRAPPPSPADAETRDYRAVRSAPSVPPYEAEPATRPWRAQPSAIPPPNDAPIAPQRPVAPATEIDDAPPSTSWKRGALIGAVTGVALVAAAIATWQLWPEPPPRVPLPLEPRAPIVAPAPARERGLRGETAAGAETPAQAPTPATTEETEREGATETVEPEPRTRRTRPRRRTAPRPRREPRAGDGDGPVLLDVDDFDRHR